MPQSDPSGVAIRAFEEDAIWQPPMIRGFVTRQEKLLHPSVQRAWGYVVGAIRSFPVEVEFRMNELGSYFFAGSRVQPRDWIQTLVNEGLAEVIDRRAGRNGGVRLRLFDPRQVSTYRLAKGDLQRPLPNLEAEFDGGIEDLGDLQTDDRPQIVNCVAPGAPPVALRKAPEAHDEPDGPVVRLSPSSDQGGNVAAEQPDGVPPALWAALQGNLGKRNVEVYLRAARFEIGTQHRIYFATDFMRSYVQRHHRAAIEEAFATAGLSDAVEFLHDPTLPEKLGLADTETKLFGAQPASQSLAYGNSSGVSVSKPASRPADFWNLQEGPEPGVVRRARELYERIGDWSMTRGMAVRAILSVDCGRLSDGELESLVAERACDFNSAIVELCRSRAKWPHIGRDKSYLKSAYGVQWRRRWDEPREPRKGLSHAK